MKEEIRHAAWLMLAESGAYEEVAEECRVEGGWGGSVRTALAEVSKCTAPGGRSLPTWMALVIVRVCVPLGARDRLTPLIARVAFDAAQRAEKMARVRHRRHQERQA